MDSSGSGRQEMARTRSPQHPQLPPAALSSGEESSGEESSGESGEEGSRAVAAKRGSGGRGESSRMTGAEKRRRHQEQLRAAKQVNRAQSKKRKAAAEAQASSNEVEKAEMAKQRVAYLLQKADVFRQFLGGGAIMAGREPPPRSKNARTANAKGKGKARGGSSGGGSQKQRRRMTEKEADEVYMQEQLGTAGALDATIPKLTKEQTAAFIEHGAHACIVWQRRTTSVPCQPPVVAALARH